MRRVPHLWREAYELAITESDSIKVIGRIEYALCVLERRCSEWRADPGTPAELAAIQKCISALARLMKQNQLETAHTILSTSPESSKGTKPNGTENRGRDADYSSGVRVATRPDIAVPPVLGQWF
jgi:hypothetical protein